MKKLLLAICLMVLSFKSDSQTLPTDLAAMRAVVAGNYACSTFHCRTKTIEAYEADSIYGFLLRMSMAISSSGNIQAALNAGNTATDASGNIGGFKFTASAGYPENYYVQANLTANPFSIKREAGDYLIMGFDFFSAIPGVYMSNMSNNKLGIIQSTGITSDRKVLIPDEGNGIGLPSKLVIHTTKDAITVDAGLGYSSILNSSVISTTGGGLQSIIIPGTAQFYNVSNEHDINANGLHYKISGFPLTTDIHYTNPTVSRNQYFPDEGTNLNILGSSFVLHKTKDSIEVDNGILGNRSVIFPGSIQIGDRLALNSISNGASFVCFTNLGTIASLSNNSGTGHIALAEATNGYNVGLSPDVLTSNHTQKLPNYDGVIKINYSGSYTVGMAPAGNIFKIPHGLPFTPTKAFISALDATTQGVLFPAGYYLTFDATYINVNFGGAPFIGTLSIAWEVAE